MNERFRELAQLAVEDAAKYCQRRFDLSREENETFALSFAELVVMEVLDNIADQRYELHPNIILGVKKHFGIEQ
jgi:hypothetical protein